MLMEAFLLTPYLAIAASFALAGTVAVICCSQPVPRGAGFTGLSLLRNIMASFAQTVRNFWFAMTDGNRLAKRLRRKSSFTIPARSVLTIWTIRSLIPRSSRGWRA